MNEASGPEGRTLRWQVPKQAGECVQSLWESQQGPRGADKLSPEVEAEGAAAQTTLNKGNEAGGLTRPDVKTYYEATVIENGTVTGQTYRPGDRTESREVNPCFQPGATTVPCGKSSLSHKHADTARSLTQGRQTLPHTIQKRQHSAEPRPQC